MRATPRNHSRKTPQQSGLWLRLSRVRSPLLTPKTSKKLWIAGPRSTLERYREQVARYTRGTAGCPPLPPALVPGYQYARNAAVLVTL
jgi:hypothetical protein